MARMIIAGPLRHGGIIANYRCTAACRHCLYACSPARKEGYIDADTARTVCDTLRVSGCRSVHIGGGEPFLDVDGLIVLVRAVMDAGLTLDYVETNAYWADDNACSKILERLRQAGIQTLCISVDPFHAEYVPYGRPYRLAQLCERAGMDYFLWRNEFFPVLSRLDPKKKHTRAEMERVISPDYIRDTAVAYGVTYGGRAVNIELEAVPRQPIDKLVNSRSCRRLISGDHFHVDLYGNFIPPGCTGVALPLADAVGGLPSGKYPVFEALYREGTTGLLRYATYKGFIPDSEGYPSACAMCFFVRRWLSQNAPSPDLDGAFYAAALA